MTKPMKMQTVKTWKESPVMETSTALLLKPDESEERAPPMDCRTRERMSQAMRNQL